MDESMTITRALSCPGEALEFTIYTSKEELFLRAS